MRQTKAATNSNSKTPAALAKAGRRPGKLHPNTPHCTATPRQRSPHPNHHRTKLPDRTTKELLPQLHQDKTHQTPQRHWHLHNKTTPQQHTTPTSQPTNHHPTRNDDPQSSKLSGSASINPPPPTTTPTQTTHNNPPTNDNPHHQNTKIPPQSTATHHTSPSTNQQTHTTHPPYAHHHFLTCIPQPIRPHTHTTYNHQPH